MNKNGIMFFKFTHNFYINSVISTTLKVVVGDKGDLNKGSRNAS